MPDEWLDREMRRMGDFGIAAMFGVAQVLIGVTFLEGVGSWVLILIGAIFVVPFFVWAVLMSLWHWKRRYKGNHSDLWGALLVLETSGWFKLIYWIRHILPDWRNRGRYRRFDTDVTS